MGEKTPSFPLFPVLVLFGILGLLLVGMLAGQPKIPPVVRPTATEVVVVPTAIPTRQPQLTVYSDQDVAQGQSFFQLTCAACHGPDAHGIPGLGKNLTTSTFVHGLSDVELRTFISNGRQPFDPLNTTGILMPPRGGNPALTDADLDKIIAFIRSRAETPVEVAAAPTSAAPEILEPFTLPIAGMDFTNYTVPQSPFDPVKAYALSCSGCHGAQGEGELASALSASQLDDDGLFALLTQLQPPLDPNLGFQHPVRGEYPAETDDQLRALIAYLHTLPTS